MRVFSSTCAAIVGSVSLLACSDVPTRPFSDTTIRTLTVSGVSVSPTTFRANGGFDLGMVAIATSGAPILDDAVAVTVQLDSVAGRVPTGFAITRDATRVKGGTNKDTQAAILLDDSGSMSSSDPQKLRAQAAQLFWEALLPVRPGNQAALLDFGAGATTGTFSNTRLLQTWTNNGATLQAKLSSIVAANGTPLYESLLETVAWMNTTTTTAQNRVILLMTDGEPTSSARRVDAINAAKAAGITVHTVGLGDASDLDPSPSSAAVAAVREVAEQTGGVYSAATTANALSSIFQVLAAASSQGQLVGSFRITPVPASGSRVRGTVTVAAGGRTGTASFTFVAP
jgi:Mg-chelatase subunit ChlD